MSPILKLYEWRCLICEKKSKSYHPVQAFIDHYDIFHNEENTKNQQDETV